VDPPRRLVELAPQQLLVGGQLLKEAQVLLLSLHQALSDADNHQEANEVEGEAEKNESFPFRGHEVLSGEGRIGSKPEDPAMGVLSF
jgi:hypothetical protein